MHVISTFDGQFDYSKFNGSFEKKKAMKTYHFPVVVEMDEDGIYIVSCPTFKGCHSYGHTIDQALENLKEVVELCMEEQESENTNQFIGIREMEITVPLSA